MLQKWEGAAEGNHRSLLGTSSFSQQKMLGMRAATAYCCEGERRRMRFLIKDFKTRSKTLRLGQKDIRQLKQRQLFANLPPCPTILNGSVWSPQQVHGHGAHGGQSHQGPSLQRLFTLSWAIPGTGVCLSGHPR